MDTVDHAMAVMEAAFDPQWGEAWNRRQLSDSMAMPNVYLTVLNQSGKECRNGDAAAGFALVRAAPGEEELLLIAVSPEFRRRGIGRILIDAFIRDAKARGAERVFLEMRFNNPACSLYERVGFEPIGRRNGYYRLSSGEKIDAITYGMSI